MRPLASTASKKSAAFEQAKLKQDQLLKEARGKADALLEEAKSRAQNQSERVPQLEDELRQQRIG